MMHTTNNDPAAAGIPVEATFERPVVQKSPETLANVRATSLANSLESAVLNSATIARYPCGIRPDKIAFCMGDSNPEIRARAVAHIGAGIGWSPNDVHSIFERALADTNANVRAVAAGQLGRIRKNLMSHNELLQFAERCLADESPVVRASAAGQIAKFALCLSDKDKLYKCALQDADHSVRLAAFFATE